MQINVKKVHTYSGHRDCIYALAGSQKENTIFSAGGEGYVVKWDLESKNDGQLIAKVNSSVYAIHYHNRRGILIVGQNNEGIHLIDPGKKTVIGSLKLTASGIFDINSWDDELYVTTGDGFLIIVDLDRLFVKEKIKLSEKSIRSVAISKKSGHLALGASDNDIYIFDIHLKKLLKKLQGHTNSVFSVKFSESNDYLISVGRDAHINFWDINRGYVLADSIPAHMYAINHLAFGDDKKLFATGSMDKTIKIWDYHEKKLLKVIDKERHGGHLSSVNKLYWSKFNNYLISASDDKTISVWDLELNY